MTLYLIGLGLSDETDITLKGLEAAKRCKYIYLDNYTSILQSPKEKLEKLIQHQLVLADRTQLENKSKEIISQAKHSDVALLVPGDPVAATTHINFLVEAKQANVTVKVIHNASIFTAVGVTGLQLYKFGKVTSVPFQANSCNVETPYQVIKENLKSKTHSLVLLDLDPKASKFMTINEAIEILLSVQASKKESLFEKKIILGAARLGSDNFVIKAGTAKELMKFDFGKPPYCIIVPSNDLHFAEEEALELWKS